MTRDMDLVRQILMETEEKGSIAEPWISNLCLSGFTEEQISHHVWLLMDAGFVEGRDLSTSDGPDVRPRCLTWRGEEFLAAIKDKDVWEQTKKAAKGFGADTAKAWYDIAKRIVEKKLEKYLEGVVS